MILFTGEVNMEGIYGTLKQHIPGMYTEQNQDAQAA